VASAGAAVDANAPGVIRGRIINAETGAPIAKAGVELVPAKLRDNDPPWGLGATTDSEGRFELKDLPPRLYTLHVYRRGFAPDTYGSNGVAGRRRLIEVTAGARVELADVALSSGGAITGSIVDQGGDPLGGIVVQALRPAEWDSTRPGSEASSDVTDDRGTFRIYGLRPGTYYLRAMRVPVMRWENVGLGPLAFVFYPGTIQPTQALGVVVQKGTEAVASFSFTLGTRFRVSGTVTGANGGAVSDGTVTFRPHFVDNTQRILERPITGGVFNVAGVAPGEYVLTARNAAGDERLMKRIVLDGPTEGMSLVLERAATLRGRIVFDTTQARPSVRPADVQMAWFPQGYAPRSSGVTIRPDWTFEATGLLGPQDFGHQAPEGWVLKEVRYGNRPAVRLQGDPAQTDAAIDLQGEDLDDVQVIFTDRITRVTGRVSDGLNRAADGVVVVFAEDRERWRAGIRHAESADIDAEGGFSIAALPPGRYLAIAVDAAEALTPSVLERLRRRATAVTLKEGERTTINLTRTTP